MGYTTEFQGQINIDPPLNKDEIEYLKKFAASRRMNRRSGPYYADEEDSSTFGREDPDIIDYNRPPDGQPGLWCDWVPTDDGVAIIWDGMEKFYNAEEWMAYIINHFLKPDAEVQKLVDGIVVPHPFVNFTFDHVLNGRIDAQGEDPDDRWILIVEDNVVKVAEAEIHFPEPRVI